MKKIVFAALAAFVLIGCQDEDTPTQLTDPNEPVAITFEEVKYFDYQGSPLYPFPAANFAIYDADDWTTFATVPGAGFVNDFPFAPTDFTNYTYIALRHDLHYGSNPDVIKIGVQAVIQQNNAITVHYIKKTNAPGDVLMLVNSQPCQVVRIPATTLPITFVQD